jgi:hypothetical protein
MKPFIGRGILRGVRVLAGVALLAGLMDGDAWAQKKAPPKKRTVYEKETVIRFEEGVVEGRVIKPDGFFLLRKRPKRWQDLVHVRQDFRPELATMKFQM